MGSDEIGRDEARAALSKVRDQRAAVRGADLDRLGLLVLAAVTISYGTLLATLAGRIDFAPVLPLLPMIPMIVFSFWRERNERVFSRLGRPIYWASLAVSFILFTALAFWIAPKMGWHGSPHDWHIALISLIAAIPLLIGAWLIGRVR
jgi:hypothetical protein